MLVAFLLSLLVLFSALTVCVRIGFARRTELVTATTIVSVALIIGPIYALGLVGRLTRLPLAIAVVFACAVVLALGFRGDRTLGRRVGCEAGRLAALPWLGLVSAVRARSPVLLGLVMVLVAFAYNVAAAYLAPSWRSWDALWYHEPIIGFTIQNHGFAAVDLPSTPIQKINGYPRLSEMLSLWFAIFAGRRLIDLPNVLLMPGLFCGTFAACRRHEASLIVCLGWAAVVTTVPAYVELLQTTFVDSALPVFVVAAFLFCTSRPIRSADATLAALAVAFAANTKISGVFPAVTLSFIAAARVFAEKSIPFRSGVATVLVGTLIVVGLSSATYGRNWILFHNPVWPDLKVDIPRLGIHWPGMWPWGASSASTPNDQVNMAVPWDVLVSELTTRPFGVTDRSHQYIYKYGLGVEWVVIPLMLAAGLMVIVQALRGSAAALVTPRGSRCAPDELGDVTTGLAAVLVLVTIFWTSTALWAPRYNLHTLAVGGILICAALGRSGRWSTFQQSVIFLALSTAAMTIWWDYPSWRAFPSVSQLVRLAATPYPARQLTPALGSPVTLEGGMARERELKAGSVLLTDDFGFPAVLWNNDYSNRVVNVRDDVDLVAASEAIHPDWIYVSRAEKLQQLTATGQWEVVGPLYAEGTALHRKVR